MFLKEGLKKKTSYPLIRGFPKIRATLGFPLKGYYKGTIRVPVKGYKDVSGLEYGLRFQGLGFRLSGA